MCHLVYKLSNGAKPFSVPYFLPCDIILIYVTMAQEQADGTFLTLHVGGFVIVATTPSASSLIQAQGTLQRLQTNHIRHSHYFTMTRTPASGVCGVVDVMNKITSTAEVLWRKGTAWPFSE